MPPTTTIWTAAVEQIDKSRAPQDRGSLGHVFPPPHIILGVTNIEKRERCMRNWLLFRPALIARLATRSYAVVHTENWRQILSFQQGPTVAAFRGKQAEARDLLQDCFRDTGFQMDLSSTQHEFTWRGQKQYLVDLNDPQIVKEIFFELFELAFREEIVALDNKARDPHLSFKFDNVRVCFAGSPSTPLLSVSLEDADKGLAAANRSARAKFLIPLMHLMLEWRGGRGALLEYAGIVNATDMTMEAEEAIIVFYVQTFFDYFGRPPTIPHRLDEL